MARINNSRKALFQTPGAVTEEQAYVFSNTPTNKFDIVDKAMSKSAAMLDNEFLQAKKDAHKERLAKLKGGVGVIKVGGGSEVEVGEIKDRVTDALCATKAALAEGIVPGGGTALLYASSDLNNLLAKSQNLTEGEIAGIKIVQNAIRIPLMKICENAGFEGSLIAAKLTE